MSNRNTVQRHFSFLQMVSCAHKHERRLTAEYAQDSSGGGDLGLRFVGGRADLDALEAEQSDDHGGEAEQQRDDHQSPTRLHVTCTQRHEGSFQQHRGLIFSVLVLSERPKVSRV